MLSNSNSKNTKLRFEHLEDRRLLAGNVTLELSAYDARDVNITGDGENNSIEIEMVSSDRLRVTGLGGTTVNGASFDEITIDDDLRIKMNGGHDVVRIDNLELNMQSHSDLTVDLGGDHDMLFIDDTTVARYLRVDGSTGTDGVIIKDSAIGRDLEIDLGDGEFTEGAHISFTDVYRHLLIEGGSGVDQVTVDDSWVSGQLNIDAGTGNDEITVQNSAADYIHVWGRAGNDSVQISKNDVDFIYAGLGSGNDKLVVTGNGFSDLVLDGGAGSDSLTTEWWNHKNPSNTIFGF